MKSDRVTLLGIALLFGLSALSACDVGDVASPTNSPILALVADMNDVVVGDTVEVEIHVADVEDLYGVALDVVYPSEVVRFVSCEGGAFLGQDGLETNEAFALESGEEGRLVVGLSRIGATEGVNGGGVVALCWFEVYADATPATLQIENPALLDSRTRPMSFRTEVHDA